MPPRSRRPDPSAPMTMKELKDTLWKAADKLRGSMDASQYKDVVLGLVFLKYVSDAFEERRDAIRAELAGEDGHRGAAVRAEKGDEAVVEIVQHADSLIPPSRLLDLPPFCPASRSLRRRIAAS